MPQTNHAILKDNVVTFPNIKPAEYTRTIKPTGARGELFSHTIVSSGLQKFGVNENDQLVFSQKFELSKIKPLTLCVFSYGRLKECRPVFIDRDGRITVFYSDREEIFDSSQIEILGVAVQLVRPLA